MLGRLFGGGEVDITVEVDRDGPYAPGEVVQASITLNAPKGAKCREVRAGLVRWHHYQTIDVSHDRDNNQRQSTVWRTDEDWLTREQVAKDRDLPSSYVETLNFEWQVPHDAPASCEGKIVQIRYLAKLTVDRAMAKDINQESVLGVVVPPAGRQTVEGEYGSSSDQNLAQMRLTLPGLEFIEGDTVRGRLKIEPRQEADVREIRLELVRTEEVLRGDRKNVSRVVEQKLQLAPQTKLRVGEAQEYDFRVEIPANGCPNHETAATRLSWQIEATLDRQLRSDAHVTQEIYVYPRSSSSD
jgi:hypothetical protein